MNNCTNHPTKKAFSICRNCGKEFCSECLDEGREYYYCKDSECQELLKNELSAGQLTSCVICPQCKSELELSDEERISGKVHCAECDSLIDFHTNPPAVINKENYIELLSSFNQGDIALIKSILEDAEIDYYIFGENFLSVDPLIQPARFFVLEKQAEDAKMLLNGFELRVWGTSKNQY